MRVFMRSCAIALVLTGCGMVGPIIKSVRDLAREACQLYASEEAGLDPKKLCKNLKPWIAAQEAAMASAGAEVTASEAGQ